MAISSVKSNVKLSSIATEYGVASGERKMSDFYRGGDNVPTIDDEIKMMNHSIAVPTSGEIKTSRFVGLQNKYEYNITNIDDNSDIDKMLFGKDQLNTSVGTGTEYSETLKIFNLPRGSRVFSSVSSTALSTTNVENEYGDKRVARSLSVINSTSNQSYQRKTFAPLNFRGHNISTNLKFNMKGLIATEGRPAFATFLDEGGSDSFLVLEGDGIASIRDVSSSNQTIADGLEPGGQGIVVGVGTGYGSMWEGQLGWRNNTAAKNEDRDQPLLTGDFGNTNVLLYRKPNGEFVMDFDHNKLGYPGRQSGKGPVDLSDESRKSTNYVIPITSSGELDLNDKTDYGITNTHGRRNAPKGHFDTRHITVASKSIVEDGVAKRAIWIATSGKSTGYSKTHDGRIIFTGNSGIVEKTDASVTKNTSLHSMGRPSNSNGSYNRVGGASINQTIEFHNFPAKGTKFYDDSKNMYDSSQIKKSASRDRTALFAQERNNFGGAGNINGTPNYRIDKSSFSFTNVRDIAFIKSENISTDNPSTRLLDRTYTGSYNLGTTGSQEFIFPEASVKIIASGTTTYEEYITGNTILNNVIFADRKCPITGLTYVYKVEVGNNYYLRRMNDKNGWPGAISGTDSEGYYILTGGISVRTNHSNGGTFTISSVDADPLTGSFTRSYSFAVVNRVTNLSSQKVQQGVPFRILRQVPTFRFQLKSNVSGYRPVITAGENREVTQVNSTSYQEMRFSNRSFLTTLPTFKLQFRSSNLGSGGLISGIITSGLLDSDVHQGT